MLDLWADLLGCLDLNRAGPSDGADDVLEFDAVSQELDYHRVFGGQLLAQFVRVATLACPGKSVKSFHTVFAREGRAAEPVHYQSTRQHEGRSFASLSITARQPHAVLASTSVSLHASEDGPENQACEPVSALLDEKHRIDLDLIPWETRSADDLTATTTGPPNFEVWMRTPAADADLAPALTAYATDLTLIGTALRPFDGFSHRGNGTQFTSAVTSHTVWFHRQFRTDRWLLLRQHSPVLAHGRCFGRGDVLTADGVLVASYAQEALLRFRGDPEKVGP
ncbi:thioesterase family protein [Candidatus Mycobacterium wuenschmannii]|uniref:Thioesterase family protein n=1 Tax=Candidatus Mycobacterium wuenschmannii TaxID=3027808 RepID=A0ABY8VSZ1_9MYCO|nr:acyl-CoA thioesterase domain-containing protein [Candidatus Mycobacterium wuenschmannii]WIM86076.1 thioesterase family protein [Candidatus Mycobacterium wuenschmannii]